MNVLSRQVFAPVSVDFQSALFSIEAHTDERREFLTQVA